MTKSEKIKSLHKILWVKEDVDDNNKTEITQEVLNSCISNCIIRFSGVDMEGSLKSKILETLNGMLLCSSSLTHEQVRSAILGLMNDVNRTE